VPLLLEAMRAAHHALAGDQVGVEAARGRLVGAAGPVLADGLLRSVAVTIGKANKLEVPPAHAFHGHDSLEIGRAEARLVRLALDTDLTPTRSSAVNRPLDELSRQLPSPFGPQTLSELATGSLWMRDIDRAYRFTAGGLMTATGRWAAEFLRIRALAISPMFQERIVQCLRAALELAQRAQDATLLRQVSSSIDQFPMARRSLRAMRGMTDELLDSILAAERSATNPPMTRAEADKAVVMQLTDELYRDEFDDEDDDDYEDPDDDYDEEDEDGFDDLLPPLPGRTGNKPLSRELQKRFDRVIGIAGPDAGLDEIEQLDATLFLDMLAYQGGITREEARAMVEQLKKLGPRGFGSGLGRKKRR
jgi:hypothetical protein